MNKSKALLFLPISALLLSSCSLTGKHYESKEYVAGTLKFKEGFKILQMSDVHLGNKDDLDKHFNFMKKTINDANADLIIVTGDVFTFADKSTAKKTFDFFDSFGTPWTMTWGNHDEQAYFSIDWLTNQLNKYGKNCIFKDLQDDDVYGNANFVINLTEDGTEATAVKQQLIIMDSNRYSYAKFKGYDAIHKDQIEWYERIVNDTKTANGNVTVPSLAFFHIPLPEFETAYNLCKDGDTADAKRIFTDDSNKWVSNEAVACPKDNTGMFDKMLELGSTKGIFVGHDHVNTYCTSYKGIALCYGIKATTRVYYENDLMGGQVVSMNSSNEISLQRFFHTYDE